MTLLDPRAEHAVEPDTDALIKEARRLRRRRWMFGSLIAALAVGAGGAGFLAASSPPAAHQVASVGSRSGGSSAPSAHVPVPTRSPDLIQPTTLAALPNGDLLILDSSRDQILELRADGRLSVFAGTGRLGFSGDGGPARDADLDFEYFSSAGMSVRPNGNVDFLDDGSCRIRQINPGGIIRTIVGFSRAKTYPRGTVCPFSDFAVSPAGRIYIANNSEIERVSSSGHLVWVAGAHGSGPYLTPSHVAFYPGALAFNSAGDLYIWNSSPKFIFELSPTGKLTQLGMSYASQLTTGPDGQVLVGTHDGLIEKVTSGGLRAVYDVVPKRVAGIHWRYSGLQEDGIAVTKRGTIYVDNAEGNGFGEGTVLVRISPSLHAALVPIRTPLASTLPQVNVPGFPRSLYPPARGSRGPSLSSCPSDQGLEGFTPQARTLARTIAKTYRSGQFASDIVASDRSWWAGDFSGLRSGGGFGRRTVTAERPTSKSPQATEIADACGPELVAASIAITVGKSGYSDFTGTLYFLDRDGHPLVYDVR